MSNNENQSKIDFQPMLKRFMVWDIKHKIFTEPLELWQIIAQFKRRILFNHDLTPRFLFCQSTNLFDKDGKEIFEGSIVEYPNWIIRPRVTVVKFGGVYDGIDPFVPVSDDAAVPAPNEVKVIGHILSNPELLEGE